jgi:hypothetical protein
MPCLRTSRRRFLAVLSIACLPVSTFAAEEPVKLPFEFDAARDPASDLDVALRIARAASRRVLMVVGGEWSSSSRALDRFFTANPDLKRYRDANYVWLKVNWSAENHNEAFLRRYPAIKGYPHLFVLDSGGRLLHSQDTEELETTKNYDPAAMRAFLVKWAR